VWILVLAPLVILLAAAGAFYYYHKRSVAEAKPVAPVVAPVVETPAGTEVSYSGVVQARNVVLIETPIEGIVETLEVEVGNEVSEGQILARIKNEELETSREAAQQDLDRSRNRVNNLESALIAARLEVSRAQAEVERVRIDSDRIERAAQRQSMLYREGATARLTYEKAQKDQAMAKAEYESARQAARRGEDRVAALISDLEAVRKSLDEKQQSLENAKTDLALAEVHSPVDGVIVGMKAKVGEPVELGAGDLFEVAVELGQLQVAFDPDPNVAGKLKDGLPATIQLIELSRDGIGGEVKRTEKGDWRVQFASPDPVVKPGINAIIKIKLN
jgi:multidrug efflux pump subunit AcrA (membrane-fusion protein)